jgi:hypothetical protein
MRYPGPELLGILDLGRHPFQPPLVVHIGDVFRGNFPQFIHLLVLQNISSLAIDDQDAVQGRVHLRLEEGGLPDELVLAFFLFGDIALDHGEMRAPVRAVENGHDVDVQPMLRSILGVRDDLPANGPVRLQGLANFLHNARIAFDSFQDAPVLPERLGKRIAHQPLKGGVRKHDSRFLRAGGVRLQHHDDVVQVRDARIEKRCALLRPPALPDIPDVALDEASFIHEESVADKFDFHLLTVFRLQRQALVANAVRTLQFRESDFGGGRPLERTDLPKFFSEEFLLRITEQILHERIGIHHLARLGVENQDAILRRLEQSAVVDFRSENRLNAARLGLLRPRIGLVGSGVRFIRPRVGLVGSGVRFLRPRIGRVQPGGTPRHNGVRVPFQLRLGGEFARKHGRLRGQLLSRIR